MTIACPNCNHPNPPEAVQCEACFTPLPTLSACPNCGAAIQSDATFCGQCGFDLNASPSAVSAPDLSEAATSPSLAASPAYTKVQLTSASLRHVQTNTTIEIPQNLAVVHIGKPNDRIPPDIDVSGFADSDVVSRVHADLRIEGDNYYIEDVGSANGTYINHTPLLPGNRHRLRSGDRVSLGKGDLVTFVFQIS